MSVCPGSREAGGDAHLLTFVPQAERPRRRGRLGRGAADAVPALTEPRMSNEQQLRKSKMCPAARAIRTLRAVPGVDQAVTGLHEEIVELRRPYCHRWAAQVGNDLRHRVGVADDHRN
jgi:hypothetical protein